MRFVALAAALLGGIAWVANLFADVHALSVAGAVLVGVAVAVAGSRLARQAWLAAIATVGAAALGWSLLELLRGTGPDRVVEGVLGGVASLVVAVAVVRGPRTPAAAGNHRG